jgi:hypothetical protein
LSFGVGLAMSLTWRTSVGAPYWSKTTAFM